MLCDYGERSLEDYMNQVVAVGVSVPMSFRSATLGCTEVRVCGAPSRSELFADAGFSECLFAEWDARKPPGERSVLSLDVFDTLVLRDNRSELRRFWEIAERTSFK